MTTSPAVVNQRILTRTRATQRKLAPQVALMVRALNAVGQSPQGGFSAAELAAPLSLKSEQLVKMLQATFSEDAALAEKMAGVVTRFGAAGQALAAGEAGAADLSDLQVQELKQAAYFLSRFHEAVKDEALLAQLFPPPELLHADAGHL